MVSKKKKAGRPPLKDVRHIGVKMDGDLDRRLREKVRELRDQKLRTAQGHLITRSDLIKTLAAYWLDDAGDIYREINDERRNA